MIEKYLPYGFLLAIFVAVLLFSISQLQRRNDKKHEASNKDYLLPEATAEGIMEILNAVKSKLPSKFSGLMLCEFEDGLYDIAIGVENIPMYIYQDHLGKAVTKVVNLSDGLEKQFKVVKNDSEFCGLFVYDNDGVPYVGDLKVQNFGSINVDDINSPFVLGNEKNTKHRCFLEEDARLVSTGRDGEESTLIPTFKIKFSEKPKTLTSPVFYDENHFLGFANILIPAMYRTSVEQVVLKQSTENSPAEYGAISKRELVRESYSVGIPASSIFQTNSLNLDPVTFGSSAINSRK